MKKFIIEFIKRGALFAGLGPLILAIVYLFLAQNGIVESVSVNQMVTEILSSVLLAFIAAGVSAVYTLKRIHHGIAGLIQGSVLLLDYLSIYLLNGWIPYDLKSIITFILIFITTFILIWLIIYVSVKQQIKKLNKMLL